MDVDPALFQENERTAPSQGERRVVSVGPLVLRAGGSLPDVQVAYETWGDLSASRDNAILVCHALSGDAHCVGWWERMVGPGKPIDTDRFFVIGTNSLGGCQGTTGPSSPHPDGRPWGSRFPAVAVEDMVEAKWRLVRALGIETLYGVAGGSMGGMSCLELCRRGSVRKAFVTASAAAHSAMQIGFNETARQAIRRDPKWRGGDYPLEDPPADGLAVARMVGHLSYLSDAAFTAKFGRTLQPGKDDQFAVESYLNYQGDKFVQRFDPNSLLILTHAIDRYACESLAGLGTEFLFTSFASDWLYPTHQSAALQALAEAGGCRAEHHDIDLPFGHDAFLLDGEIQGGLVREFLSRV